ncbi:MAG: SusC/RagA family TonB-linked outer membrane protein [Bacteroidales bacterium]|nr:SusC/RagA family TonB-linked outer membrane protein [Bacteroidales bacterium]MCF8389886.1 SusC/RagA family TonB-linked outer membrane protein [Bacteroidales bacterium]
MRIKILFIAFLIISGFSTTAKAQIVRGVITDSITHEPLIGATVMQIDKSNRFINGSITDISGNFTIKVVGDPVKLGFSYIGYNFKEIETRADQVINIALSSSTSMLDEVVVTAERTNAGDGLSKVAVRDLATSVATIDMSELSDIPTSSVSEALQGRISGVDVSFSSGDPGAGMSIKIRGTTSLNGQGTPLIVLDGVPYETNIGSNFSFQDADVSDFGSLVDISPADIKSIQILKDAAATAVWGSKAANGVIIINSKRGVKKKTQFSLDYRNTYVFEPDPLPMLDGDQYVRLMLDERFNSNPAGLTTIPAEYLNDPSYSLYNNYNKNTDWVNAVTQNGYTNDLSFSVAGGGDKARYRASVGYYDQLGTTIGTDLTRITTRLNLDYNISNKLKLSTDFSYANSDRNRNYYDGEDWNATKQVRSLAYRKAPHMSIYEYDTDGMLTGNYFSPQSSLQGSGQNYPNPVAMAMDGINNENTDRILTNFTLQYDLLKGLSYYANVSFDVTAKNYSRLLPQSATGVPFGNSDMNKAYNQDLNQSIIQTYNKLIYTPELGEKHNLMVLGQVSSYDKYETFAAFSRSGLPSFYFTDPSNDGFSNGASSERVRTRTLSYTGNIHYVYDDRYILSSVLRVDGDSRFGPSNRYGYFPAVSAAWRISSENFMSEIKKINDLKLRISYGENGGNAGRSYQYLAKYNSAQGYMGYSGIQLGNVQLNNLQWETTSQMNYGIDLSLFNYRFGMTFDYYTKVTKDMLFNALAIPSTSGFSTITNNLGTMSNTGWELNLNGTPYKTENLSIHLDFNFATNQNTIEDIPDNYANERFSVTNGQYARRLIEGNPRGAFYGFNYLGVFANPEDAVAKDADGNPIIDPVTGTALAYKIDGRTAVAGDAFYEDINKDGNIDELDLVYLGNGNPDLFGGFGINIIYKKFSLSSHFNYKIGQDVINSTKMSTEKMYNTDNQSTAVLRRWRANGDVTDIPRAVYGQGLNWLGSSRFVEDASFLRLKTLTFSYMANGEKLKSIGISNVKAFITAYNIMTLTNYTGQDPEVGFTSNDFFGLVLDYSKTPPPVSFTAGISMSF